MLGQINPYARLILAHYSTIKEKKGNRLLIAIKLLHYKPRTEYMLDVCIDYAINT